MVQHRQPDEVPNGPLMTVEELARRQGVEPVSSIGDLIPEEPLFDDDEHAAFLKWLRKLRQSEVA